MRNRASVVLNGESVKQDICSNGLKYAGSQDLTPKCLSNQSSLTPLIERMRNESCARKSGSIESDPIDFKPDPARLFGLFMKI